MPNIGPGELLLIAIIAIIFIGPGRLPDVGAALGKSIREFRKASSEITEATRIDTSPLPPTPAPTVAAAPVATAAPAPTPEPSVPTPTASTVPAPVAAPPESAADDEPTNLPA